MPTPATAPQREIGYAQSTAHGGYWWMYDDEQTPELVWPQSVYVYDAMRRTDSQVASVLRAVTLPVRRTPWRIDPNGARDEVVELIATDLGLPIVGAEAPDRPLRMKDRFSWPEHLRQALLMLPFGHSYFEVTYRVDKDGNRAHLHKLSPRPAKTIERIEVARDGGLVWIKQYPAGPGGAGDSQKTIPVSALVAYVHDREGGNWLGTSVLRPAYKNWLLKDRLLRVQAQTIERNGMGIPLYKAQEGATADDITAGRDMATAWRAGEAAGSAVPFGADLVLRGVEGTLPDALPVVKYHDEQVARAVLAHFLNLDTQSHGSYALGASFMDFFTLSLQTLAQQIADTATMHVIEDIVDANWGEDEPAPRLVFDEIGSRQAATAQAIKLLIDAGIITPDAVLEESERQRYGLPPADPESARGEDESDVDADAMVSAIDAFRGGGAQPVAAAAGPDFNRLHPRGSKGRFRDTFTRILDSLAGWAAAGAKGEPLPESEFSREQLRRVAVKRPGITLPRAAKREVIRDALLDDLRRELAGEPEGDDDEIEVDEKPAPAKKAAKKAPAKKAAPKTADRPSDDADDAPALDAVPRGLRDFEGSTKAALGEYAGGGHQAMNARLRGDMRQPERFDRQAELMDEAMESSRLTRPVTVWRGLAFADPVLGPRETRPDDLTGTTWTDPAYSSTSVSRDNAEPFGSDVLMRIVVPEGTPALKMSDVGGPAGLGGEGELLLPRGLTFRVVRDNTPPGSTQRVVDVEVTAPDDAPDAKPVKKAAPKKAPAKKATPRAPAKKAAPDGASTDGRTEAELRELAEAEGIPLPKSANREQLAAHIRDFRFHRDNPSAAFLVDPERGDDSGAVGGLDPSARRPAVSETKETVRELREIADAEGIPLPRTGSRDQLAAIIRDFRFHRDNPTAAFLRDPRDTPDPESAARQRQADIDTAEAVDGPTATSGLLGSRDPSLTAEELSAIGGYTALDFTVERVQTGLRSGDLDADLMDEVVRPLDSVMARSRLDRPVQVHRGIYDIEDVFPGGARRQLTGEEFADPAFVSTTDNESEAAGFAEGGPNPVVMRIAAPAGTPALRIDDEEMETLLGRGLRFRVTGDTGPRTSPRRVDVEVVPANDATPDPLSDLRTLDPEAARDALDLRTVAQLKPLLKSAGLPVSGRKRDLVDRLVGHVHPPKKRAPAKKAAPAPAPSGVVVSPAPTIFGNVVEARDVSIDGEEIGTAYLDRDGDITIFRPAGERASGPFPDPPEGAGWDETIAHMLRVHESEKNITPERRARTYLEGLIPSDEDLGDERMLQASRWSVVEALTTQADIVPHTVTHLDGFQYAGRGEAQGGMFGWGYGESARYEHFSRRIRLSPHWSAEYGRMSSSSRDGHESGWYTPTPNPAVPGGSVAHEFGHHVVKTISFGGFDRRQYGALMPELERSLDLPPGTLYKSGTEPDKATINARLAKHADVIRAKISGYAAQHSHGEDGHSQFDELLAEVWQEYSMMGKKARPHIKKLGDILRRLAEEAAQQR